MRTPVSKNDQYTLLKNVLYAVAAIQSIGSINEPYYSILNKVDEWFSGEKHDMDSLIQHIQQQQSALIKGEQKELKILLENSLVLLRSNTTDEAATKNCELIKIACDGLLSKNKNKITVIQTIIQKLSNEYRTAKTSKIMPDFFGEPAKNDVLVDFSDTLPTPLDQLKTQITQLKTQVDQLQNQASQLNKDLTTVKVEKEKFENEKKQLSITNAQLTHQHSELGKAHQTLQTTSTNKEVNLLQRISVIETESQEFKAHADQHEITLNDFQSRLNAACDEKEKSNNDLRHLQTQHQVLQRQFEELQQQLKNLEAEKLQLIKDSNDLQQQVTKLKQSLENANQLHQEKIKELNQRNLEEKQAKQAEEQKNQQLVKEVDNQKLQVIAAEKKRDKLVDIFSEARSEKPTMDLTQAEEAYNTAIDTLKADVAHLKTKALAEANEDQRNLAKQQLQIVTPYLEKMRHIQRDDVAVLTAGTKALTAVHERLTNSEYDEVDFKCAMMNFASLSNAKIKPETKKKIAAIAVITAGVLIGIGVICLFSIKGIPAGVALILGAIKIGSIGMILAKAAVPIVATTGGVTAGIPASAGFFAGKKVWQSGNAMDLAPTTRDVMHRLPAASAA